MVAGWRSVPALWVPRMSPSIGQTDVACEILLPPPRLAAHFSYSRQEDGLVENTQLLARQLVSVVGSHGSSLPARYQQVAERVGLVKM